MQGLLLQSFLGGFLKQLRRISDAKDELQIMAEDDLRLLKGFLDDVDKNQAERSMELDLERQVKELVRDLRDIRQDWLIHDTTGGGGPLDNRVGSTLKREIHSIIHLRLEPALRMIRAYRDLQLQQKRPMKANQDHSAQLNREVPPVRVKKIVGFEDEADTLISYLVQETKELDLVSITGMPGIGKTTLAWKIYQNKKIRSEFPIRIWVDIPHDLWSKDWCLNILKEFIKQGMVGCEVVVSWLGMPRVSCSKESFLDILDAFFESGRIKHGKLIYGVRTCLELSKFLIVLDAVWTAESLKSVRDLSPRRGKVLITSCNTSVCVKANATRKPHVPCLLNEKESWDLLQLEVFGRLGECPEMLKSTGQCIAKNCDGLPLAIVAVGSNLGVTSSTVAAKYLHEQWWKKVSQKVAVYAAEFDQQRVFKRIELSYIKLADQYLQYCFLYLGVFPEGEEIPVRALIRLWISEGLAPEETLLPPEETAQQTLHDLIGRNMVMVGKNYPNGQIKTCRLHRVMYEFCKYKAAQNGFYHDEIKMSRGMGPEHPISLAQNHHRLCIHYSHLSEFLNNTPKGGRVRSILCFNKEDKLVLHPEDSFSIHKCFKLLRVLECRCVNFTEFPNKLSKLMLLRHISLSCDNVGVIIIPETISSLCYLQTLIVDTQSSSIEIKANIWRMFQLRHLVTKAAIILAVRGKGKAGKNLQTLTRLAPECCTEDVFKRAPNLKTLGIRGALAALSSPESLRKLEFLENLKLINEPTAAESSQLHRLILPNCFAPNLKRLSLSGTYLGWERMSILRKINGLEILKLKNNAFIGESWTSTDADDGFRHLGFLLIGTTDLVSWEASDDCFPSLKCLVLNNCGKLHKIPSTLAKSLDKLDVEKEVSESAVESAREIERQIARRQEQNM